MDTTFQEHQKSWFGCLKAGEFEAYQHKACESEPELWYVEKADDRDRDHGNDLHNGFGTSAREAW